MNFTAPVGSVPLPRDFRIPEGATLTFSTTPTGKPVAHISGPGRRNEPSHWAPEVKENQQVAKNSKAFEVTLTNGEVRTFEAIDVVEADGRVKFLGVVEGHNNAYGNDVVASFLNESVAEFRTVPVAEEPKTGANDYVVHMVEGDNKTVTADRVLHSRGNDKSPGQFTFVTDTRNGENRTEFLVGEDKVNYIERADGATVPAQAAPADTVKSA